LKIALTPFLAWYFVAAWGAGYIATKAGLQYAPPFTFLALRFGFGLLCLLPVLLLTRTEWPKSRAELAHLAVAGVLMHLVQLGGSHYAQYLGMSAGVAALLISCQPLLTSMLAPWLLGERVRARQWAGVAVGLAGVALVVWHKIDVREVGAASLACTAIALTGVTAATLYQKRFAPRAGLKAANTIQFAVAFAGFVPLAWAVEGFEVTFSGTLVLTVAFLVIFTSLGGLSVLYFLLRHGEASRVSGMMYLPPVFAVVLELAVFGVAPGALMLAGMALACLGVAMIVWNPR
jgi:drug/metabolite transporter (DMT)-like permease